jgi:hypothetical protein
VGGETLPLPAGAAADLLTSLETLLGAARALWPNSGRGLERVVLGGGGAARLAAPLRAVFPQLVVPYAPRVTAPPEAVADDVATWPDTAAMRAYRQATERAVSAAQPQFIGARGFAAAAAAQARRMITI